MPNRMLHESNLKPEDALWSVEVRAGDPFVHEVRKGQSIRIVDVVGDQSADVLFLSAHNYQDRYSVQDTIRTQGNIYLTTGSVLMSTERNRLLTITADTCGRHDTLGGACSKESNQTRYALDRRSMHACREVFLRGAIEWTQRTGRELSKRDLTANINFFMNVPVTTDGRLEFADGISGAGKYVELRAEHDVLMLVSNCPQLNNPCNVFNPTPLQLLAWD